jgi:hypothetical protein
MSATAAKKAQPMRTIAGKYLTYNHLTDEDRRLFAATHLHLYLDDAYRRLFPQKNNSKKFLSGPPYNPADLDYIVACIKYALGLIGRYSNERFGETAAKQHAFFQRQHEQETFFTHLFRAVQLRKRDVVSQKNPAVSDTAIINNEHVGIEALNNKQNIFAKIGGSWIKENDLYAAGIFYAINFSFDAVKSNDAGRLCRLLASMFHFGSGSSYEAAYGQKGGKANIKRWAVKKERAYELYLKHDVYKKYKGKHEAICVAMKHILRRNSIRVAPATLETRWVPEFVKRHKASL